MNDVFSFFFLSMIEWFSLISFPLILLGYPQHRYTKNILITSIVLSTIAALLRLTPLHLPLIVGLQMVCLFIFFKKLFKMNLAESLVITGIGYSFYLFIQLLIIELIMSFYPNTYLVIFSDPVIAQISSILIVTLCCYLITKYHYTLNDLRDHLQIYNLKKDRNFIFINVICSYLFICLAIFSMLFVEIEVKYPLVLSSVVMLFINLITYLILHSKIQAINLIEAKKLYLDQEEQYATIVEKLKLEYEGHLKAIVKLSEKGASSLISEYVDMHKLLRSRPPYEIENELLDRLGQADPLLYVLLVNKRKLAHLFSIKFDFLIDAGGKAQTTLQHVRYLSMILDDIIIHLHYSKTLKDKWIRFHIESSDSEIYITISSNLLLEEEQHAELKLYDILSLFNQRLTVVQSNLKPLQLLLKYAL